MSDEIVITTSTPTISVSIDNAGSSAQAYANDAVVTHVALSDPHTQYVLETDIGTTVQAYDPALQSLASLGTAADKIVYSIGVDTFAESSITAAGRALLDDASAADQRTTLGLVAGGSGDVWVEKAGDTMTGPLVISSDLTVSNQAALGANATIGGSVGDSVLHIKDSVSAYGGSDFAAIDLDVTAIGSASVYSPIGMRSYATFQGSGAIIPQNKAGAFKMTYAATAAPITATAVKGVDAVVSQKSTIAAGSFSCFYGHIEIGSAGTGSLGDVSVFKASNPEVGAITGTGRPTSYTCFHAQGPGLVAGISTYRGLYVEDLYSAIGSVQFGVFIEKQTALISGTLGGIKLNGNGVGSDVVYGTASGGNSAEYFDGTNHIIDPDRSGSGRVYIGVTGDDDMLLNSIEIDGDLNHDGSNVGFYGVAPVARPSALTAADSTALDGTIGTNDTVTDNIRTRLNEVETKLKLLGLLT